MEAAVEVMGGILERPHVNSVPLALENLKLAACAIADAVTETERNLHGKDSACLVRAALLQFRVEKKKNCQQFSKNRVALCSTSLPEL